MNNLTQRISRLNLWPVSIISFFVIAIVGCGSFIAFCSRHPADLVAADYYEQEVRYQAQINRSQNAGQHAASVTYDPATAQITLALPPNPSHAGVAGHIHLYRPSAINLDREFKLEANADGVQTIDANSLLPGLWKVRVTWTVANQDYFIDQKLVITPKSS